MLKYDNRKVSFLFVFHWCRVWTVNSSRKIDCLS